MTSRSMHAALVVLGVLLSVVPAHAQIPGDGTGLQKNVPFAETDGGTLHADITFPSTHGDGRPAVVLVHGGGWRNGRRGELREAGFRFAELGWVAVDIDYRLDGPSRFPGQVEDVERAVRWVADHAEELGVDPDRVAVLGSSAGGNLAALAATRTTAVPGGEHRIAAVVSWSGPMDLSTVVRDDADKAHEPEQLREVVSGYLGCLPEDCPAVAADASPITHVDPSDPPMLLVNSTDEQIPAEQATSMASRLQGAGVAAEALLSPGRVHGRGLLSVVLDDTVAFLQRYLVEEPVSAQAPAAGPPPSPSVPGVAPGSPAATPRATATPPDEARDLSRPPAIQSGGRAGGAASVVGVSLALLVIGAIALARRRPPAG